MKKILFAISVLVLSVGAGTSCQRETEPLQGNDQNPDFCMTATIVTDADTKMSYVENDVTHAFKSSWEMGDIVIGFDDSGRTYGFMVTALDVDTGVAKFTIITEGEYAGTGKENPGNDTKMYLFYADGLKPGDINTESRPYTTYTLTVDISFQGEDEIPTVMKACGTVSGDRLCVSFTKETAIIGIKNPTMGAADISYNSITVSGVYTEVEFSITSDGKLQTTYTNKGAILKAVNFTSGADKKVSGTTFIVVCPLSTETDLTFTTNYLETFKKTGRTMDAGHYYYMTPTFSGGHIEGALPGLFTTGGTQVFAFAKGNVYYDNTASKNEYKFEANQYDYRYDSSFDVNAVIDGEITKTPDNTLGVFLWVKNTETVICPYDASYGKPNPDDSASDVLFTNATAKTPNRDFSVNGETGIWRSLSSSEVSWIIAHDSAISDYYEPSEHRKSSTVNGVENARFAKATVNGVTGLIIFPDIYFHPSGLEGPSGINSNVSFEVNSYTDEEWLKMESAGAVFLPTIDFSDSSYDWAYRKLSGYINKICGCYMESNTMYKGASCVLIFHNSKIFDVYDSQIDRRYCRCSMRLVASVGD